MVQVAPRVWRPDAVHDTVQAVVSTSAYRRSLQSSLAERLLGWLGEWVGRLFHALGGAPSARAVALVLTGVLVALAAARVVLAAQARDAGALAASPHGRARAGADPWWLAERLAADGRFEEAAHALYRGVLAELARSAPVRLHPSKTSGDYARELRARRSPAYPAFRAFTRRFDLAVYGHGRCDAAALAELRALAAPFAPAARAA